MPGIARVIIRLAATQTQDTKLISPLKLISPWKLMSQSDRIHFVFTLKLADPDTHFGFPGLPGSMSTPTDLLPSPRFAIDSHGQNWSCTAIPKRLTYTYCMAIYGLCNVV